MLSEDNDILMKDDAAWEDVDIAPPPPGDEALLMTSAGDEYRLYMEMLEDLYRL
jgi:hypothetical protein